MAAGVALLLAGCGARNSLPQGAASFPAPSMPIAAAPAQPQDDYRIGPRDVLMMSVFGEPDLTFAELPVSAGGYVAVPLIGQVVALGRTTAELSEDIDGRLAKGYLRHPKTAISVVRAVNYTITIDGAVNRPGVYDIPGRISLSQSLALAQGSAQFAKLGEVVVVRQIDGTRHAARFDLRDIRAGRAPDFELQQQDIVVIGYDNAARLFRDIVTSLPSAAAVFVALR